ncbi:acyltransferase [Rhizobium sp. CSW-27]|uniref:acyltransferase family protein n=1 Tax=Rhizobium sp. CSW-27 TaxID=2839985 RepID=UPI001C00B6C0|nr:acyltransferase [Rhizobium sp. CSW-27]MBT9368655.1 acyltransferase [Rhizobium sp. CSW-27]
MQTAATETQRFDALHGARGLAAIAVMCLHLQFYTRFADGWLPGAYLAVDLFFLLSGFVIAHAYDARLRTGLSPLVFLRRRLARLYPLYALSLLISALVVLERIGREGIGAFSRLDLAASFVLSAVLLPVPPALSISPTQLFPLNGPAWSLFLEILLNLAFGCMALLLTRRRLAWLIGLAGLLLALVTWHHAGLDVGTRWDSLEGGLGWIFFSFLCGIFMRRFLPLGPVPGPVLPLVLMAGAFVLAATPAVALRPQFDLAVVVVVWPCLLRLASGVRLAGPIRRAAHALGEASYGIYILHMPLMSLMAALSRWLGLSVHQRDLWFLWGAVPATALLCVWLNRAYDEPVRRRLAGRGSAPAALDAR